MPCAPWVRVLVSEPSARVPPGELICIPAAANSLTAYEAKPTWQVGMLAGITGRFPRPPIWSFRTNFAS